MPPTIKTIKKRLDFYALSCYNYNTRREHSMENLPTFQVDEVIENEDGTATVKIDVPDDFKEWFKKDQGLKRWSGKRFEKWFNNTLKSYISAEEESDEEDI